MHVVTLPRTTSKALDIYIQDQHTDFIFIPFHIHLQDGITLTADTIPNDRVIHVSAGHGFIAGSEIAMGEGANHFYGGVQSVSTNALTLDQPFPFVMTVAGTGIARTSSNMAVDGDPDPIEFHVYAPPDAEFDITGIHLQMVCDTEPDDSKFGDLAALTYGEVLRVYKGDLGCYVNYGVARTNGDFALFTGGERVSYTDKAGGGKFAVRVTANFPDAWGNTVRLRGANLVRTGLGQRDEMHMIIQDDIDGLDSYRILAIGHVVE